MKYECDAYMIYGNQIISATDYKALKEAVKAPHKMEILIGNHVWFAKKDHNFDNPPCESEKHGSKTWNLRRIPHVPKWKNEVMLKALHYLDPVGGLSTCPQ